MLRKLEWTIVASLLLVCAGIPLFQVCYEVAVEKESPYLFELLKTLPTKASLHRWDDNAKDRSLFSKWLRPRTLQLRFQFFGEMAPKSLPGEDGWLFYNQDADYLLQPPYTDARFYKGTFDSLLNGKRINLRNPLYAILDFRNRLKARGIELLIIPIPGKPSIYPEKLWKGFSGQPVSPSLVLLEDLKNHNVQTVDLFTPMLVAKTQGGPPLYLMRDTHWSPHGMEVAAEIIATKIRKLGFGLYPNRSWHPRYALKNTSVERWGDIAEMTKVPNRKSIWEKENMSIRKVLDLQTSLPYQDDTLSPILWLGDSFSRIYQTDEPTSSGIIAHLAYRLNRPLTSLVNDGGASTVVRQLLSRRGDLLMQKKLVVWTFVERDLRFGAKGWQIVDLPAQ